MKLNEKLTQDIRNHIGNLSDLNTKNKQSLVESINEINNKSQIYLEEQIIGAWINEKPLYRKVYEISNSNPFSLNNDMDELIFSSCTIQLSINNEWRPVPWLSVTGSSYQYADYGGGYYISPDGGWTVHFQIGSQLQNMKKGIMVFIYTKTTD